jgi:hypothetical protein
MSKREDAREIHKSLGLPQAQQDERSCRTLLALAGLAEDTPSADTQRPRLRIWVHEGDVRTNSESRACQGF